MKHRHAQHCAQAVAISRRRLLANLVAAAGVVAVAPVMGEPMASLAQTPVASKASMPTTLAADASPRFRAVAEALMAELTATGTPGGALGILAEGRAEYAAFGVDSIDAGQPVALDTLFQIGSTTKTVTGTAVMRLVAKGTLDLDATVRTYLPDFRLPREDVAARVTLRHLLTHTGGWWGDFFADTGAADDAITRYVARWFPTLPQLSPLGVLFSYNNSGFALLGRLIEVVTGQTYRRAAQELVLHPLGLAGSYFAPEEVMARPHAQGHFTKNGAPQIQEPLFLPRSIDPAGGLWSTAPDLIRYAAFHLGDGTVGGARILPRETLDLMQTTHQPIPVTPTLAMGMPWFVADVPGQRFVTHDGDTFGQHAQLWLAPARGFAMAVLVNSQPSGAIPAQAALIEAFVQYLGLGLDAAQMATPVASPPPVAPQPAHLDQYVGRYEAPSATYDLRVMDNALLLSYELHRLPEQVWPTLMPDVPPQIPIQFIAEDLALVTIAGVPQLLGFVRRDDGDIGWASASLRLIPKVATA